jgi:hypothetical protein
MVIPASISAITAETMRASYSSFISAIWESFCFCISAMRASYSSLASS